MDNKKRNKTLIKTKTWSRYFVENTKEEDDLGYEYKKEIKDLRSAAKFSEIECKKEFKTLNSKDATDTSSMDTKSQKSRKHDKLTILKVKRNRKKILNSYAKEQAKKTELLLLEEAGFIECEPNECETNISQQEIVDNVDILSGTKHFKLNLDFGPYRHKYTKNGRHLLIGGRKGHVAAFDWISKKLHFEMNVLENVVDVTWLHLETMLACAQKDHVFIYDNKGTELHTLKCLYHVNRMEFLNYHFLLATANESGYLSWVDISTGKLVNNYNSKLGRIQNMRQNPSNGVICVGSSNGVVSMWSPNIKQPLAKMLCHPSFITCLAVDQKGNHLITAGGDLRVKIWDIRKLDGPCTTQHLTRFCNHIDVSQRGDLVYSMNQTCQVHFNLLQGNERGSPLLHNFRENITDLSFVPYEDVLGVSTIGGFQSLLVPGSGEPNYDAYEANPFMTTQQRKNYEVRALLEKIPAELITLDPTVISSIDKSTLKDEIEKTKEILSKTPLENNNKTRNKMKGKGGSVNAAKNKQIMYETKQKKIIKNLKKDKDSLYSDSKKSEEIEYIPIVSVLDRFNKK